MFKTRLVGKTAEIFTSHERSKL